MELNLSWFWWNKMKDHQQAMKREPDQAEGYGRAAMIAYAQHLCYNALYWQSVRP